MVSKGEDEEERRTVIVWTLEDDVIIIKDYYRVLHQGNGLRICWVLGARVMNRTQVTSRYIGSK